jgi:LysR family glycine cleavage system transcriptional activator
MRRRLPPLNSLRLFEASARLLSFKNAAEELLVTPSAVSHGIQSLEEWLGVELFQRTTRGLVLSEAGIEFLPIVTSALDALASGSAKISSKTGSGVLAISAAPTFAARWLLPRLHKFRLLHPEIRVVIDTSQERTELSEAGADVAIRLGRGNWQGVVADLILKEKLVPVCAPSIFDRVKNLERIDDAPLIHVVTTTVEWTDWAKQAGREPPDLTRGLQFDTLHMAFEAAAQGLGVALGRRPLVDPELELGRLVEVWGYACLSPTAYWLVSSENSANETRIVAFREWIRDEAERHE